MPDTFAIIALRRNLFFRHGEQMRLCVKALREAGGPRQCRWVADYAMAAKGLPADDPEVRSVIIKQTQIALARLERKRITRRVLVAPDVWWEIVL